MNSGENVLRRLKIELERLDEPREHGIVEAVKTAVILFRIKRTERRLFKVTGRP